MTTLEINIIDDEDLIINVLRVFEKKHSLTFKEKKSIITPGKPMTEIEYENMLNESRNSRSYTLEQAKQYLGI
jgi:hypothetical protein